MEGLQRVSPKLDQALRQDFPNLFHDRHGDMRETAMCWGFECGDGWEPLIRRASEKLEPLIVSFREANPGYEWYPRASQIKEKYGTLRFYLSTGTDEMCNIVEQAERESEETCETCGQPGRLRGDTWLYTACDKHTREEDKGEVDEPRKN